jgi:hypothetical protein
MHAVGKIQAFWIAAVARWLTAGCVDEDYDRAINTA